MEPDETGLLKSVENNEWRPVSDAMELKSRIKQAAKKNADQRFPIEYPGITNRYRGYKS
jgi:hypothetical protein